QFLQVFFHLSFRNLRHSQSSLPAHFLAALSLLPSLSGSCHHKSFHLPSWCRFPVVTVYISSTSFKIPGTSVTITSCFACNAEATAPAAVSAFTFNHLLYLLITTENNNS